MKLARNLRKTNGNVCYKMKYICFVLYNQVCNNKQQRSVKEGEQVSIAVNYKGKCGAWSNAPFSVVLICIALFSIDFYIIVFIPNCSKQYLFYPIISL